jgi:hypothetical protein
MENLEITLDQKNKKFINSSPKSLYSIQELSQNILTPLENLHNDQNSTFSLLNSSIESYGGGSPFSDIFNDSPSKKVYLFLILIIVDGESFKFRN